MQPVGEIKSLVTLVDRGGFDEFVYPKNTEKTVFQPSSKPYHNFTHEVVTLPFSGRPDWGQRITFTLPWPWHGDFLQWIALRLKPLSWMDPEVQQRIGKDFYLISPETYWIWTQNLGTAAIARAELEVGGVIIESFSGDWLNVWNKTAHECSRAVAFDDSIYNQHSDPASFIRSYASEDGYVYCYLPFAFSKYINTALPLLSCSGSIRIHITLKKFSEVVRYTRSPRPSCNSSPLGTTFDIRDYSFPFRKITTIHNAIASPGFASADILCGMAHLEDGEFRTSYIERPHELLLEPVTETQFNEPLKYLVNTGASDTIKIALPLTMANGPIKQIMFFVRRKAAIDLFNDWTNYSAVLPNEIDPVWNPNKPLLVRAQLMIGTAVWAEGDEAWWGSQFALANPGGIRASGNYIYGYNFADKPYTFDPSGSANACRVDMRLNLTIAPPGGSSDGEWTVSVFLIGQNWMRFQNGIANMLFMN